MDQPTMSIMPHAEQHDPMMADPETGEAMMKVPQNTTSHLLSATDPDNPMNWPSRRRLYATLVSAAMAYTVAFGLTIYAAGIPLIMKSFDVNMTWAVLGFSIYLFGIFFAPIYTPHLSERYGRSIIYLVSIFLCALFHLGAAMSPTYASLIVCRFFAGLTGGPCLVLIEGTFADIWAAETTNTYYAFLGCASYFGAASGPIVGNFVIGGGNWRWAEYTALFLSLFTFALGIGMPETYGREIPRRRNKARGKPAPMQPPAESGVTIAQMVTITVVNPIKQLVMEPIVMMISFTLALNWAVTFQWFITVPVVLNSVYNFSPHQYGLAFISAIGGASLAALCTIGIEQVVVKTCHGNPTIEKRLIPAMYGSLLFTASLFWVGNTADPKIHYLVPIFGTAINIWGGLSVLISLITYLFDAYPPAGTLSALTAAACLRIATAGIIPLVIIPAFMNLTGKWALSVFGFISIPLIGLPFVLYIFGPRMRARSTYTRNPSVHTRAGMGGGKMDMPMGSMQAEASDESYRQ